MSGSWQCLIKSFYLDLAFVGATYRLWGGGFVEVSHFVIMLRVSLGFRSRYHILLPRSHTMGEDLLKIVIISPRFSH